MLYSSEAADRRCSFRWHATVTAAALLTIAVLTAGRLSPASAVQPPPNEAYGGRPFSLRSAVEVVDALSQLYGRANVRGALVDRAYTEAGLMFGDDRVNRDVRRAAKTFGLSEPGYLRLIEHERGLAPGEGADYLRDIMKLNELQERDPKKFERLAAISRALFPELKSHIRRIEDN